jgi:HAE1 family hydrophobic/amphiphilic exporter-1
VNFTANIKADSPTNTATVLHEINNFYQQIRTQYPGANLIFAGDFAATQKSYTSLAYAFVMAIFIYWPSKTLPASWVTKRLFNWYSLVFS